MTVPVQVAEIVNAHAWGLTARGRDLHFWRRAVAEALEGWCAPGESVQLACLGVSELLTNVVQHVEDPRCFLKVARAGTAMATVQVFDRSPQLPVVTEPVWDREGGRGLWMLREMAGGLNFQRTSRGKRIWFRCGLDGGGAGDTDS